MIHNRPEGTEDQVVPEDQNYQTSLLPGFELLLAQLLMAADRWAQAQGQ